MRLAPQEIIDHVIDFIHDDFGALSSARLVCQSWNVSARVHLFCKLDLLISESPKVATTCSTEPHKATKPGTTGVEKFRTLLSVLETSPDISPCVREVTIGNTSQLSPTSSSDEKYESYSRLLTSILSHLPRVLTLYLREITWIHLHPSFLSLIVKQCQSPSLTHLDVWNCQMTSMTSLMEFLNLCSGITSLRLSHIGVLNLSLDQQATHGQDFRSKPRRALPCPRTSKASKSLQHLTIESVPLAPILYALLATTPCSVDLTRLRRLCLSHINDPPSVRHFLDTAGSSLEHLELRASSCQTKLHSSDAGSDLSLTPRLRHLRISGLQWTQSLCPAEQIANFFAADMTDPTHPLESIHILLNVVRRKSLFTEAFRDANGDAHLRSPTTTFDYSQWGVLDEVLSQDTFSSLKKVQFQVDSLRSGDVDPEMLQKAFQKLRAKGEDRFQVLYSQLA